MNRNLSLTQTRYDRAQARNEMENLMEDRKIRTAVIGLGVGSGHVHAYKAMPNAELVAICDLSEPWLKYCQNDWNVAVGYTDYRELLASDDIDAVSIALPTKLHAEATIEALEAGKHVLVEKPMAVTTAEAQSMADAAKRTGRVLMVSYNQRFGQDVMFLKRYIEEGNLGDIYFARTMWRRPMGCLPPPMADRPTGAYNRNWFNEADNGGGVARDLGSHVIDIAMWLMGFPEVQDVAGRAFNMFLPEFLAGKGVKCDADDHSVGFVRFTNGACLQIEAAFGSYADGEKIVTEIFGSKGGVFREAGQAPKLFSKATGTYTTTVPRLAEPQTSAQAEFVNAILSGKSPVVTPDQGVAVTRIIDGIYGK